MSPLRAVAGYRRVRTRGVVARLIAGLWLALHIGAVSVLPIADARADSNGPVAAHVEDRDAGNCPALHDASVCQLCSVMTSVGGPSRCAPRIEVSKTSAPRVERTVEAFRPGVPAGEPASRAPPRA